MKSINHLQHLAAEFYHSLAPAPPVSELANSLLDLLVQARKHQMTGEDLIKAAHAQLIINQRKSQK